MKETTKDSLDRLKQSAQSVSLAAASDVPEIQEILEGKTALPENCRLKKPWLGSCCDTPESTSSS